MATASVLMLQGQTTTQTRIQSQPPVKKTSEVLNNFLHVYMNMDKDDGFNELKNDTAPCDVGDAKSLRFQGNNQGIFMYTFGQHGLAVLKSPQKKHRKPTHRTKRNKKSKSQPQQPQQNDNTDTVMTTLSTRVNCIREEPEGGKNNATNTTNITTTTTTTTTESLPNVTVPLFGNIIVSATDESICQETKRAKYARISLAHHKVSVGRGTFGIVLGVQKHSSCVADAFSRIYNSPNNSSPVSEKVVKEYFYGNVTALFNSGRMAGVTTYCGVNQEPVDAILVPRGCSYNAPISQCTLRMLQKDTRRNIYTDYYKLHTEPSPLNVCRIVFDHVMNWNQLCVYTGTQRMPLDDVYMFGLQLLQALDVLHTQMGCVHTDLSIGNVLFAPKRSSTGLSLNVGVGYSYTNIAHAGGSRRAPAAAAVTLSTAVTAMIGDLDGSVAIGTVLSGNKTTWPFQHPSMWNKHMVSSYDGPTCPSDPDYGKMYADKQWNEMCDTLLQTSVTAPLGRLTLRMLHNELQQEQESQLLPPSQHVTRNQKQKQNEQDKQTKKNTTNNSNYIAKHLSANARLGAQYRNKPFESGFQVYCHRPDFDLYALANVLSAMSCPESNMYMHLTEKWGKEVLQTGPTAEMIYRYTMELPYGSSPMWPNDALCSVILSHRGLYTLVTCLLGLDPAVGGPHPTTRAVLNKFSVVPHTCVIDTDYRYVRRFHTGPSHRWLSIQQLWQECTRETQCLVKAVCTLVTPIVLQYPVPILCLQRKQALEIVIRWFCIAGRMTDLEREWGRASYIEKDQEKQRQQREAHVMTSYRSYAEAASSNSHTSCYQDVCVTSFHSSFDSIWEELTGLMTRSISTSNVSLNGPSPIMSVIVDVMNIIQDCIHVPLWQHAYADENILIAFFYDLIPKSFQLSCTDSDEKIACTVASFFTF